jgi:molybdenum cofactor cytidylyltransferase
MRIGAVILAAGASRRMGADTNKLLLPIDGIPMVRRTVARVQLAGIRDIVVVTGHEGDKVRAALEGIPCTFVESPDPTGPTSGSLHAGLRAFGPEIDATLVMLADMVRVTTAMIATLMAASRTGDAPLEVSRYGEVLAPPLLFRRSLWPELLAWHGEGCGKAVVRAHLAEASIHEWREALLADIDTAEDYAALTR